MTSRDNDKIFTAADIRRYLSGQMSAAEMFALESAALEDPFLADAIEGFDKSSSQERTNHPADIKELHDRLHQRIADNELRRLPLFLRKNIAAILILLAGAGTMVYYLVEKNGADRTYISQKESASATLQDTVSPSTGPTEDPVAGASAKDEALQPQPARQQSTVAESNRNRFKKDIGYSSAIKPGSGDATAAARKGVFSSQIPRADTMNVDGKELNDNNKAARELAGRVPGIETKRRDSIPSRMMETANSTTSRSEEQAPQVSSPAPGQAAAVPGIGWKAYDMYVEKNKKLPASLKNMHGKVVLSFNIGQTGKAENVQVVQSLHKKMDEEAIRLVKEGPAWNPAESAVIASINF